LTLSLPEAITVFKRYLTVLLGLFVVLASYQPLEASPAPRIQNLAIKPNQLADIMGNRQLTILHRPKTITTNGSEKSARFVTSMAIMDTDVESVREIVLNLDNYDQYVPQTVSSEVVDRGDTTFKARLNLLLEMPVMSTNLQYTNQYTKRPYGDVTFKLVQGDLSAAYGRYEFIKLGPAKTLLIYTSWSDIVSGLSYFGPAYTMFSAQPDLKIAVPVAQNAVFMRAVRKRIEDTSEMKPDTRANLPKDVDIPTFNDRDIPVSSIKSLYNLGTILFVHPDRWIRSEGNPLGIKFVSAMGVANVKLDRARSLLTQFEKFPRFIEQVSSVQSETVTNGYKATWNLSIGMSVLSAGINYKLRYQWKDPATKRTLKFRILPGGDLDHVYGALEWIPAGKNKTIFVYTVASQIGENASYLVQLGDLIPNRQLVMGVSSGALAVEKQMKWINETMVNEKKSRKNTGETVP
jgi:ribosome-associated toxin RatA of RatAB toxin-antitoxin module